MKTYKLLKVIDSSEGHLKVGGTFMEERGYFQLDNGEQLGLSRLIKEGYIEEVKDTRHPGRYWKPEGSDTEHWYATVSNNIQWGYGDAIGSYRFGNCFQTAESAQIELEKRKAIVKIKEYISDNLGVFEPDWEDKNQEKFIVGYSFEYKRLMWLCSNNKHYSPIGYFSCKDHAVYIGERFDQEIKFIHDIE